MEAKQFKNLIKTFIDPGTDKILDGPNLMFQVNDIIYECQIEIKSGEIFIHQENELITALNWIKKNLAKLEILAHRIENIIKTDPLYVYPELKCEDLGHSCSLNSYDEFSQFIKKKSILSTGVIYLTSDAGEGKTSFINELALNQTKKFLKGDSDYLIVPISLGGRTFHRFDDIVIGTLANRFRFPFINYEAFLELVKIGIIVPALDGFEEMFVESGTGEALSAMGILLNGLDSCGSVIVSARKAYYEFENLKMQPKLFDIIKDLDVNFYKVDIERWDKEKFVAYLKNCKIDSPENIYNRIIKVLPKDHAILTRPVLVKKFIGLIQNENLELILPKLQAAGNSFFSILVDTIITREANEKWLDKIGSDQIFKPILSIENHYDLLSLLAYEMWNLKKDYLTQDIIVFVVEYYAELKKLPPEIVRQVKDRLKGHALLAISKNDSKCIEFDHEEFKDFFLAKHISSQITKYHQDSSSKSDIINVFRKGLLNEKVKSLIVNLIDKIIINNNIFNSLESIAIIDGINSYAHQNTADILSRLLSNFSVPESKFKFKEYNFSMNTLNNVNYSNIEFINCNFASTKLENSVFNNCNFTNCEFETFPIVESTNFKSTFFESCKFISIEFKGAKHFDPNKINYILKSVGLLVNPIVDDINSQIETDIEIIQLEKILRYFLRSTHISESVIRMKLGNQAATTFIENTIPQLLEKKLIIEVENKGGVQQKRFKLGVEMSHIEQVIEKSKGNFRIFLDSF